MPNTITAPLKWHGGKHYLASRIIALMPPHIHFVEPFFGGGAVLLHRDPEGVSEVVNDINGGLINFWRVLQGEETFHVFQRRVEAIPLSRTEWEESIAFSDDVISHAVAFFVRCRQSLAGRMKSFTAITRTRTRRGMNGNVSEWLGAVDGLPAVHERLRRVVIENMDAIKLIQREDTEGTLFYCDPPYAHETRAAKDAYQHEMTSEQHAELLSTIRRCKGKVMISGYDCPLYAGMLANWRCERFELPNNSAGGAEKRRMVECIWMNY